MTESGTPRTGTPERPNFYGRRRGRPLNASLQQALDEGLLRRQFDTASDPATAFPRPMTEIRMEIGFGSGEHLIEQASQNPDIGFIGCEPFLNGVAKLVRDADARGLDNILVYADDARHILDALPEGCLARIYVLFPDPWRKKRHWFRRFIGPENMPRFGRTLQSGGLLQCATDHPGYLDWILFHVRRDPAFDWLARRPGDWTERPEDQPPTRYETKALAGKPHYLRFLRR